MLADIMCQLWKSDSLTSPEFVSVFVFVLFFSDFSEQILCSLYAATEVSAWYLNGQLIIRQRFP